MTGSFAFNQFVLDTGDRRLKADDRPVDLNGRYFDALALLIRERGKLVTKDRFLSEVWQGVPVTDEALTQCIKTLRRQLGDDASRPRFIETVPKHGYRFIAPVEALDGPTARREPWVTANGAISSPWAAPAQSAAQSPAQSEAWCTVLPLRAQSNVGSISVLLVLLCVTLLVAIVGAAGVSFAIATSVFAQARSMSWLAVAGAGGGLVVGAFGKMLGHDAFPCLSARPPGHHGRDGRAPHRRRHRIGHTVWAGKSTTSGVQRSARLRAPWRVPPRSCSAGDLMLGSLALLTSGFPDSRLRSGGRPLVRGKRIGPGDQLVSATLEAGLFSACVVAALTIASAKLDMD